MLHEFVCHPCTGAMLIFSVSFQFQYMCCRSEHLVQSLMINGVNSLSFKGVRLPPSYDPLMVLLANVPFYSRSCLQLFFSELQLQLFHEYMLRWDNTLLFSPAEEMVIIGSGDLCLWRTVPHCHKTAIYKFHLHLPHDGTAIW